MVYQKFFSYISSKVDITEEEFELIKPNYRPINISKKEFFLKEGGICTHGAFVIKGALRKYYINENNEKLTLQFAIENWWISDRESFTNKTLSKYNIQAIEDCELLIFNYEDRLKACNSVPAFQKMSEMIENNSHFASEKRITSILTETAESRYKQFVESYPDLIQRFPQHMIASYLGIQPETLSRLRRKST